MKTLEVRRHSLRKKGPGSQLSQEGVSLARQLGASLGPFDLVVSSVRPRARETAIALGFAVDYELQPLVRESGLYDELEGHQWWTQAQPFVFLAQLLAKNGEFARYAHALAELWRDLLNDLPDGAHALLISHSGDIECALVAAFPQHDHSAWGSTFACLEGARLFYGGPIEHFYDCELLRLAST